MLQVPKSACEYCGGSDNLRAARRFARLCRANAIRRLVIVGGSPSVHAELETLKAPEWELRLVSGTDRRTTDKARADLDWAQLVFIWGSSELDHKVSRLYTDSPGADRRKLIAVARRGVAALLNAGTEHLERSS